MLLASGRPQCVLVQGPPEIGKTELTKFVADHDDVKQRFGEDRRWFVELDKANSAAAMQSAIAEALRADLKDGFKGTLALLRAQTRARPALLVLDNLETPWLPADERAKTEATLAGLAAIPGLALLASFRGTYRVGGAAWEIHPVGRLPEPLDAELFRLVAGGDFQGDPCLPKFLKALEGLPLAIDLVARRAHGHASLGDLWRQWQAIGTKLAEDPDVDPSRTKSLNASIELSLASERLKATPGAGRLFAWLGQSPAGVAMEDCDHWLGAEGFRAGEVLVRLGLAVGRGERLDMLSPIREYSRRERQPEPADFEAWTRRYLELLETFAPLRDTEDGAKAGQRLAPEFANVAAAIDAIDLNNPEEARLASWARTELGDVLLWVGRSSEALNSFRAGLAMAKRLAKADPGNAGWQRDLSVSYNRIGDVLVAQGNLPEALKSFRDGLAIRELWRKPTPATPAGSATSRCPTRRSATFRWRRAICRRR